MIAPLHAAPLARTDAASAGASPDDSADAGADSGNATQAGGSQANAASTNTTTTAAVAQPASSAPAAPAPVRDIGRSVREVSRPLLEELTHSDVAEAVRALDAKPDKLDAGLENTAQEADSRNQTSRNRNWDGTGQRQAAENAMPQNANRDPEREKARAATLLSGLINEIKPWAFGAVVLYMLGYIAKFSLAARRRTVQRRMERRRQQSHSTQNKRHSQQGRP